MAITPPLLYTAHRSSDIKPNGLHLKNCQWAGRDDRSAVPHAVRAVRAVPAERARCAVPLCGLQACGSGTQHPAGQWAPAGPELGHANGAVETDGLAVKESILAL